MAGGGVAGGCPWPGRRVSHPLGSVGLVAAETGGLPGGVVRDDGGGPVRVGVVLPFVLVGWWGCSGAVGLVGRNSGVGVDPPDPCDKVMLVGRATRERDNPTDKRTGRSPPPPVRVRGLATAPDRNRTLSTETS